MFPWAIALPYAIAFLANTALGIGNQRHEIAETTPSMAVKEERLVGMTAESCQPDFYGKLAWKNVDVSLSGRFRQADVD